MKQRAYLIMVFAVFVVSLIVATAPNVHAATTTISYQATNDIFTNPERGFYWQWDRGPGQANLTDLDGARTNTNVVLRRYYMRLDDYRTADLPQSYLDSMRSDFSIIRQAGHKVIVRFAYNFGGGADAPLSRMLGHIQQVGPVLNANKDIIAFIEAGFIGQWGEWHHSNNGLTRDDFGCITEATYKQQSPWSSQKQVVQALLNAVPDRFVNLRYSRDKRAMYDGNPITSAEAFNGSEKSRIGHINDAYLHDSNDAITYIACDATRVQAEKDYLRSDNLYVPQGGETWSGTASRSDCTNAVSETEYLRFDVLNLGYDTTTLNKWKTQGCFTEIERRLGYRLQLNSATIENQIKPGGIFSLDLNLSNVGFGKVYNARKLEVVLRERSTGRRWFLATSADPRRWSPGASHTVNIQGGIPTNMPSGTYDAFLFLPDPAAGLRERPIYAIRLANANTWEAATGYNSLNTSVTINANASGSTYSGSSYFTDGGVVVVPTNTPGPTATPAPIGEYEGEASGNTFNGQARVVDKTNASGGKAAGYIGNGSSNWVRFNSVNVSSAGNYTIRIRYFSAEARTAYISVNGGGGVRVDFPALANWDTVGTKDVTLSLSSGTNTLRLYNDTGYAPDIDKISVNASSGGTPVPTTAPTNTPTATPAPSGEYEGEASGNTFNGQARVVDKANASGGKAAGYIGNGSSNWVRFNSVNVSSAGNRTVTIRYISAEARTAYVSVNGGAGVRIDFPALANWDTVGTKDVTLNLSSGTNTLRFYNDTGYAPDIDKITVR